MAGDTRDDDSAEAKRRAFLQGCGRFAIVTPPVVTLMLSVSDKAEAATSAKQTTTTPTTTTPTTTIKTTTATTISTSTISKSTIPTSTTTTTQNPTELRQDQTTQPTQLAMVIDSMGLMKL